MASPFRNNPPDVPAIAAAPTRRDPGTPDGPKTARPAVTARRRDRMGPQLAALAHAAAGLAAPPSPGSRAGELPCRCLHRRRRPARTPCHAVRPAPGGRGHRVPLPARAGRDHEAAIPCAGRPGPEPTPPAPCPASHAPAGRHGAGPGRSAPAAGMPVAAGGAGLVRRGAGAAADPRHRRVRAGRWPWSRTASSPVACHPGRPSVRRPTTCCAAP
jgi:hypothetical protein